jgi:hypothetical protein
MIRRTSDKLVWFIIAWLLLDKFGCAALETLKFIL